MGLFSKREEKRISLYSIILNEMDEHGRLPWNFSLPHDTPDNQIRFALGATDGIGIFHTAGQDVDEQTGQLAALLEKVKYRPSMEMIEIPFDKQNIITPACF